MSSYKKIDFNVPVLTTDGQPQMRAKMDRARIRRTPQGGTAPEPIIDADGYVVQEVVYLSDIVASLVDNIYPGEEAMTHSERLERGELARKLSDKTKGSLKNYYPNELKIINDVAVKAQLAPSILAQVEELQNVKSGKEADEVDTSAPKATAQAAAEGTPAV